MSPGRLEGSKSGGREAKKTEIKGNGGRQIGVNVYVSGIVFLNIPGNHHCRGLAAPAGGSAGISSLRGRF